MRFNPVSPRPKVFFAEITSNEAQEILEKHNTDPDTGLSTNFRRLSEMRSKKYGADMRRKHWVEGVATLDFDPDGILLNGQHTLRGCVLAGRSITVTVRTGLPVEAVQALDAGKPRTEADAMKQPAVFTAVGRWIFEPSESPKVLGRLEMITFYEKHRTAIEFVLKHTPSSRGVRIGPVLAPIARAWYTQDREELKRFMKVLGSNLPQGPGSNQILTHVKWLQDTPVRGERRVAAYWRTERVLKAFLSGETVQRVVLGKEELFPLRVGAAA